MGRTLTGAETVAARGNVSETVRQRPGAYLHATGQSVHHHGGPVRVMEGATVSQQDSNRTLLKFPGDQREFSVARPSTHDLAMLEELRFVRREAQAEASDAYEAWRLLPGADSYAVYRAAQDRADAAQDELARWVRKLAP
jgi:hypothetical protein